MYCKEIQGQYADENQMLKQELRNAKLDLEHATTSRREMQQVLQELDYDNSYMKVPRQRRRLLPSSFFPTLKLQSD